MPSQKSPSGPPQASSLLPTSQGPPQQPSRIPTILTSPIQRLFRSPSPHGSASPSSLFSPSSSNSFPLTFIPPFPLPPSQSRTNQSPSSPPRSQPNSSQPKPSTPLLPVSARTRGPSPRQPLPPVLSPPPSPPTPLPRVRFLRLRILVLFCASTVLVASLSTYLALIFSNTEVSLTYGTHVLFVLLIFFSTLVLIAVMARLVWVTKRTGWEDGWLGEIGQQQREEREMRERGVMAWGRGVEAAGAEPPPAYGTWAVGRRTERPAPPAPRTPRTPRARREGPAPEMSLYSLGRSRWGAVTGITPFV